MPRGLKEGLNPVSHINSELVERQHRGRFTIWIGTPPERLHIYVSVQRGAKAKRESTGRRRGGQTDHQGHGRSLLPTEQVDHLVELRPVSCHQCGHLLLGEDGTCAPSNQ
jgi:hypothetical protein